MESTMHTMQEAGRIIPPPHPDGAGPPRFCPPTPEEPPPLSAEQANNAVESRLLAKFEELNVEIATLRRNGDRNMRRSRSTTGWRPKRYYWSCRCCPHWGRDCDNKKEGHTDDTSFKTRKGIQRREL